MMTTVALSPAAARPSSPQPSAGSGALVATLAPVAPAQDKAVAAALELETGGGGNGDGNGVDENASVNVLPGREKEPAAAAALQQAARHAKRAASPDLQRAKKKRRRVAFESADIVEFEPTVFTTTVTSGGIPLGMSLKERSRTRRRLDSFELERMEHRVGRENYMEEGYLDPQERELILNNAGCEEPALLTVEAEVNQIIADRRESNEIDFEFLYGLAGMEEEEEQDDESNQVMLEEEQEADEEEEEEEEEDGDESNQEDDAASALLSTSTTLEESSSEAEAMVDNNSTDEDAAT